MAIVETYKIGNATVNMHDDAYRDKTPAEITQIDRDFMAALWDIVLSARAAGKAI